MGYFDCQVFSGEKLTTRANYILLILFAWKRIDPIDNILMSSVIDVNIVLLWSRSNQSTQNFNEAVVLVMDCESRCKTQRRCSIHE
jgi:hypothetical protein